MFFFIIQIRRTSDLLKIIWNFTNSSDLRKCTGLVYQRLRKIQLVRTRMQQFVTNLNQYILNEVIEKMWAKFKRTLDTI